LWCNDEDWKVVLNWPFDPDGHDRSEAVTRAERFRSTQKETRTLVWVPAFLTLKAQADLGNLVTLDNLLRGEQLDQYAQHLSAQDRATARGILDSQRNALANSIRLSLEAAYGFRDSPPPGMVEVDGAEQRLFALWPNITLRPPVGATFKAALEHLVSQALEQQLPAHPAFGGVVKIPADLRKIHEVMQRAVQSGEPRVFVDRKDISVMRQVAEPLELGRMGDTHFVPIDTWTSSKLVEQISSAGSRLGVTAEQLQTAARYRTAGAVGQLLQSLNHREPTPCVRQLALARMETSAAAMAKSLTSAADVLSALKDMPWSLLDSLGRIADDRQVQAQKIRQDLRQALLTDEHVTGFALALRDARDEAYRLLAQAATSWGQTSRSAQGEDSWGQTSRSAQGEKADQEVCPHEGQQGGLDAAGLARLVAELTRRLQQDPRLRLEVRWVLHQEGNQP